MGPIINLILMKKVNVKKLKSGDFVLAFDPGLCEWFKCKVNEIKKYTLTLDRARTINRKYIELKYIDGCMKDFVFYETPENLKNPDYYKQVE